MSVGLVSFGFYPSYPLSDMRDDEGGVVESLHVFVSRYLKQSGIGCQSRSTNSEFVIGGHDIFILGTGVDEGGQGHPSNIVIGNTPR